MQRRDAESEVELTLFYVHQTPAALAVAETDDEGDEVVWLPKDAIAFERKGVKVTVWAPEKLLLDKGLI